MLCQISMESVFSTIEKNGSLIESVFSVLAAALVFASAVIGLCAVRSWVDEKRRHASRIMIAVLEAQDAIGRIRYPYHSASESALAKRQCGVSNGNFPMVIGRVVLNRINSEKKHFDELRILISISEIVFGIEVKNAIYNINFQFERIKTNTNEKIKQGYQTRNLPERIDEVLFDTLTDDDKVSSNVKQNIETVRKKVRRYLPPTN